MATSLSKQTFGLQAIRGFVAFLKSFVPESSLQPFIHVGERLFKAVYGDTITANIEGLKFTVSVDQRSYLYCLQSSEVQSYMIDLFKDVVQPGMVVLDIGTHIGTFTLLAAQRIGNTGKVYAFEPDPINFRYLTTNIQENQFEQRVVTVHKAVADQRKTLPFHIGPGIRTRNSLFVTAKSADQIEVECIAIDEFLDQNIVADVVKIDIEGAEVQALEGMKQLIARSLHQLKLFIECNPNALQLAGSSAEGLIRKLEDMGLRIFIIDEQNKRLQPVTDELLPEISTCKYVNLYCYCNAR
jgi:FkbM family methyltransferase